MTTFLASLLAMIPGVFIALLQPIVTEVFLLKVIKRVVVPLLEYAAESTKTSVDNKIVEDIKKAWQVD